MLTKIKLPTKILAVLLTMLFVLEILPTRVMAEAYNKYTNEKQHISDILDNPAESDNTGKADILYEVTEKRDEHTKVYKRADGTYTALVSQTPLHFLSDGIWKEIDNTLVSKNGVLTNADNPFIVTLPERITSNSQITLENDGNEIAFAVNDISASASKIVDMKSAAAEEFEANVANTKSEVKYEDVAEDTDIEYVVLPNGIKENIIVSDAASIKDTYSFEIEIGNLSYRLNDGNSVEIVDADNNVKFTIPAPVMTDSKLAFSYDIGVSITDNNNGTITLVYTPSKEWTGAFERAYPITIDPAIYGEVGGSDVFEDTVVYYDSSDATKANTNYYDEGLAAISNYTENNKTYISEVYTKIDTSLFQMLGDGVVITDALYAIGGIAMGSKLYAKYLTSNVDLETVTYNTKPNTSSSTIIDYYTAPRTIGETTSDLEMIHFNITKALNDWMNGATNYGMAIVAEENTVAMGYINGHIGSMSTSSVLILDFVYVNGYNDLYNYHSQDIGRAGTGYVNDFTRSMSLIRNDHSIPGNIMPVSIDMVYNPALFDYFTANSGESAPNICGANWMPSYYRAVQYLDEMQIIYFTETGSEIDFIAQTGANDDITFVDSHAEYIGDSGYTAEILEAPENYEGAYLDLIQITRPDGYIERFNEYGALISVTNPDYIDQHINIYYIAINGIDCIDYITDGVGRKYDFVYDSTTNLLSEIVCKSASNVTIKAGTTNSDLKVSYTYDNEGYLTAVTFADGKVVHYSYDSNGLLTSAENIDGYKVVYTYGADKKVSNVNEFASNNNQPIPGNHLIYTANSPSQVTIRDKNNAVETYIFNSSGQLLGTVNSKGNYRVANIGKNNETFYSKADEFRPLSQNILQGPSFEDSDASAWTMVGSSIIDYSNAKHGNKAIKISATDSLEHYIAQSVYATGKGSITLSAYIRTDSEIETNANKKVQFYIESFDSSESSIGNKTLVIDNITEDWQRFSVTLEPDSNNTDIESVYVKISSTVNSDIFIDAVQLENSCAASDFNNVVNGGFTNGKSGWNTATSNTIDYEESIYERPVYALQFAGGLNTTYTAEKTIAIDGKKDDIFNIGGWLKSNFVRNKSNSKITDLLCLMEPGKFNYLDNRFAQINYEYSYTDGETTNIETGSIEFSQFVDEWQFASSDIVLLGNTNSITITVNYSNNINPAKFTGLEVSYVGKKQSEATTTTCNCEGCEEPNCPCTCTGGIQNCACDECHRRHNSTTTDAFGNITSTTVFNGVQSIVSSQGYSTDGNYLTSETDSLGNTYSYDVNTMNGIITAITEPEGNTTNYAYDAYNLMTAVYTLNSQNQIESNVQYTYTNDRLTAITHNGFTYNITYDVWGQMTEFAVGSQPIISYQYGDNNHRDRLTYVIYHHTSNSSVQTITNANRLSVLGDILAENNEGDVVFQYKYNTKGDLIAIAQWTKTNGNISSANKYNFEYDSLGNTTKVEEVGIRTVFTKGDRTDIVRPDNTYVYSSYIDDNSEKVEIIGGIKYRSKPYSDVYDHTTGNTTSRSDVQMSSVGVVGTAATTDYFGRTTEEIIKTESAEDTDPTNSFAAVEKTYTYYDRTDTSYSSNRVKSYIDRVYYGTSISESSLKKFKGGYRYEYDDNGNICEEYLISTVNTETHKHSYEYDNLNQLTKDIDYAAGETYIYNYDNAGNIVSKTTYTGTNNNLTVPDSVITYTYDSTWGDKLVSYSDGMDSTAFSYDNIGNPVSIGDNSFTWIGRQLLTYDGSDRLLRDIHIDFQYDENGLRHHKDVYTNQVLTDSYDYVWLNERLISQTHTSYINGVANSTNTAKFIYDNENTLLGFIYNDNSIYLYTRDIQGDITSIVNESGVTLVTYTYSTWGKRTSHTEYDDYADLVSELNLVSPFAYRGYCYDKEMDLYYLQSRYYSHEIGRFINTDDSQIAIITQSNILGANLFAYCENNPINLVDYSGFGIIIFCGVAFIIVSVVVYLGTIIYNLVQKDNSRKKRAYYKSIK